MLVRMTAPYRDAVIPDRMIDTSDEPKPLATLDVSGRGGADGEHGMPGAPARATGADGGRGGDAGLASPGEGAGEIRIALIGDEKAASVRIEGSVVARDGKRDVRDLVMIDENGFLALRAIGGDGGRGGNGGRGGDGADGADGSDATRYSSGSNGGAGSYSGVCLRTRSRAPLVE